MRSPWLGSMAPDRDGVVLRGAPAGHAADLCLRPGGAELCAGGAIAHLDWAAHGGIDLRWSDAPPGTWRVTYLATGRSANVGVGIDADSGVAQGMRAVRAAVDTRRNRTILAFHTGQLKSIPLRSVAFAVGFGVEERHTLAALVAALAARPELRVGLADPAHVARLARDVGVWPLTYKAERNGLGRGTAEALRSMRALGYRHALGGRPLAGDPLPSVDEVVDAVLADVGRNPSARGIRLDRGRMTKLVRRHYLDVDPWPFAALTVSRPPSADAPDPGADGQSRPEVPNGYGAGHRPTWWRSTGPWVPRGARRDA